MRASTLSKVVGHGLTFAMPAATVSIIRLITQEKLMYVLYASVKYQTTLIYESFIAKLYERQY